MRIQGLQKLTLLDYPGKMACTVFTAGCNFRCPFCHNASLVEREGSERPIEEQEFFSFLKKRRGILEGVCVTGGEPLLQADIAEFLARVKALGYLVKLDTNGSFPEKLRSLTEAGLLDYVAMDIKNSPENYAATAGLQDGGSGAILLERVRESASYLLEKHVDYEFRTTVVRELHEEQDFLRIGEWLQGAERYFLQGFVDSGDLICQGLHGYTAEEMRQFCKLIGDKVPSVQVRGVD